MMKRRSFLKFLGFAGALAPVAQYVRPLKAEVLPPVDIAASVPSGNTILTPEEVTKKALAILHNKMKCYPLEAFKKNT